MKKKPNGHELRFQYFAYNLFPDELVLNHNVLLLCVKYRIYC